VETRDAEFQKIYAMCSANSRMIPFHSSLALGFESQVEIKRPGGSKIVHDDTHMIDALDLHVAHLRLLCTIRESSGKGRGCVQGERM
jgi:hypothetical protein